MEGHNINNNYSSDQTVDYCLDSSDEEDWNSPTKGK